MTEPTCRWVSTTQPRVLPGRHVEDCADDFCRGCQPCLEQHCRVCGVVHDVCCAGCRDDARTNLREIQRMCSDLPEEVEHKGVQSQAMSLLLPVGDPESWHHHAASALAGRIVPIDCDARDLEGVKAWLAKADGELHPLWVLGTWEMAYRDALEHDGDDLMTIESAAAYLDTQLTYIAGYDMVPFEDLARDLRACDRLLRRMLHDQHEGDRANVGCFDCRGDLERRLSATGFEDYWTCRGCRRRYTTAEYNFALRAAIEADLGETA